MAKKTRGPKLAPPELPPKTEAELAAERELCLELQEAAKVLRRRNLQHAVLLAQQAACGIGPLVDHFAELGRRYAELLDKPHGPTLRRVAKAERA